MNESHLRNFAIKSLLTPTPLETLVRDLPCETHLMPRSNSDSRNVNSRNGRDGIAWEVSLFIAPPSGEKARWAIKTDDRLVKAIVGERSTYPARPSYRLFRPSSNNEDFYLCPASDKIAMNISIILLEIESEKGKYVSAVETAANGLFPLFFFARGNSRRINSHRFLLT